MKRLSFLPIAFVLTLLTSGSAAVAQPHGSEEADEQTLFEAFLSTLHPQEDAEVPFPAEPMDLDGLDLDGFDADLWGGPADPMDLEHLPHPTVSSQPSHSVFEREPEDAIRPRHQRATFPFEAFDYDDGTPTIHCLPSRICSVELAPGEAILGRAMGDPGRWLYQELNAGSGDAQRVLVAFMPKNFGARTNLILTTDQRIYTLDLVSADVDPEAEDATPPLTERARFDYPEAWAETREGSRSALEIKIPSKKTAEATKHPPTPPLDFHYTVVEPRKHGRRFGWRPITYDDGTFTYVRLPSPMADLPAVRGIDHAGEPFPLNETYRRVSTGTSIEIPRLINRIELSSGTGRGRRFVTIYRNVRIHE